MAEMLADHEVEIAALRTEATDPKKTMFARAIAAEKLVQAISAVCQRQFARIDELKADVGIMVETSTDGTGTALDEMGQKAVDRLEKTVAEVKEAERSLNAVKETMQSRAETLLAFIAKREKEFLAAGESREGAKWKAAVEIVYSNDDEIAAFRVARAESEERATACEEIVEQRKSRQAFAQQYLNLLQKIQNTRNQHDEVRH